jgi:hypothetical protein
VNDVRANTSAGQWFDIQKAAMMGGKVSDNPIFGESLGVYRNLLLIESTRIPTFTDGGAGANIKARVRSFSAPRLRSQPTATGRTTRAA